MLAANKRILLIKMDHIGDALWAFPAIRALAEAFPTAELDMLCTPYLADAFRRVPWLQHVIEYDGTAGLTFRWTIIEGLRQRAYDASIVLGPVDKVNHLAFLSGARERIGYAYAGNLVRAVTSQLFLTRRLPHPADLASSANLPLPHEVPALLSLVAEYGADRYADHSLFFPTTLVEKNAAADLLKTILPTKSTFAALHLCAKSFSHGWTATAFSNLASQLQQLTPELGWVVTAGPAEKPFLPTYQPPLTELGIPVITGMALGPMAAILEQMRLLVSWDTGVVHLASAVNTPVIDIFPDKDYDYCVQRWGPRGSMDYPVRQASGLINAVVVDQILSRVHSLVTQQ